MEIFVFSGIYQRQRRNNRAHPLVFTRVCARDVFFQISRAISRRHVFFQIGKANYRQTNNDWNDPPINLLRARLVVHLRRVSLEPCTIFAVEPMRFTLIFETL